MYLTLFTIIILILNGVALYYHVRGYLETKKLIEETQDKLIEFQSYCDSIRSELLKHPDWSEVKNDNTFTHTTKQTS